MLLSNGVVNCDMKVAEDIKALLVLVDIEILYLKMKGNTVFKKSELFKDLRKNRRYVNLSMRRFNNFLKSWEEKGYVRIEEDHPSDVRAKRVVFDKVEIGNLLNKTNGFSEKAFRGLLELMVDIGLEEEVKAVYGKK